MNNIKNFMKKDQNGHECGNLKWDFSPGDPKSLKDIRPSVEKPLFNFTMYFFNYSWNFEV